ncbi:MAG TPA: GH92 family glycosyl hydrolase [Terracidiphilus sp.]|nr:GH92 family glycosyl hydrolase [Terracidiphilus sp.]
MANLIGPSVSRRRFLQSTGAMCVSAALPLPAFSIPEGAEANDPIRWVDPRIGTGGHGHCFPGVSLPFGAVQLSPDTFNDGWDWCSGYHISDDSIIGFSHTHLSGTGCGDLLDFLVMAGVGPVKLVPGSRANPDEGYRSRFSHHDETTAPGYYSVLLKDPNVRVELTATERTGLHKYTFPESNDAWLIVDLAHSYLTNGGSSVYSAELRQVGTDTLSGGHVTRAWGANRHCYFTLQVSQQPTSITFYSDDKPVSPKRTIAGDNLKAVLHFKTRAGEAILVRTGISGVSADGAAKNLHTEQADWDFDKTSTAAKQLWRQQLSRIQAQFANQEQKRIFYTSLYHMSLGPQLFDDVDGRYRGMNGEIHQLDQGARNYTTFSLWDTFRAAHPAYTLVQTDRVADFMNTLIRMAEQSPAGMPVWPLQGTETGTMTGYHSASVISEAIVKGIPGINLEAAYRVMMQRAMIENYEGLGYYRQLGYIPADRESESVSKTFEYCYNDWAISQVADKLGHYDEAAILRERSANYRHYFNPASGFMEPKLENGDWARPFDPIGLGHSKVWRDYTESNAWQTTFGTMHDAAGLIALFGGREPFLAKLDALFTVPSTLPPDAPPDIAGLVGQYAHGNEPSHHIAYLYMYAGAPWKTQARVRSLLDTMYKDDPDGITGNEDVGQMSAWFVLSSLGFYAVDPVSGTYVLGSPLVEHAVLELGAGKRLEIEVKRSDPSHAYVQSFTLNGRPQQQLWFRHADIAGGGQIVLELGPGPNQSLGIKREEAPPSLGITVPTVANGKVYVGTRGNNIGGADNSTSIPGELDVYGLLP